MVIFLNAQNLEIIKYVQNKNPKIVVEYNNLPKELISILKKDTKIIAHYSIDVKNKINDITSSIDTKEYKGYNYLLRLDYKNKKLTAILYDLLKHKTILYKKYKVPVFNVYPFMIHSLSYDINSKIGFAPIEWIKRKIVYAVYMAPKEQAIFLADVTFTYRKKIISGGLNIFPKWANKNQTEIYYTKLENMPVLYKYNIYTGQKERVMASKGMLIVSDVKGDELLLTLAIDDQPDIYLYNKKTNQLKQITKFVGIDVNGQFYDKNKIIFISDRLGYPNVYEKNLDTGIVKKVIYHGRNHISVSANKDKLVLSSRETNKAFDNNTFNLLLVNKNTNLVKRLTFGGKNMMPVFSYDGTAILFIKEYKFNSKLGIIRVNENKIFYFKINRKIQSFDF